MKTLKLSALALVGAFFFVSQGASAQTTAPVAKKAKTDKVQAAPSIQAKKATAADSKAVTASDAAPKNMTPSGITWKEDSFNFGDIEKGKPVSHEFTFKNTTSNTVLITNVKASCGCTATNYTKTPVKPGETASVTATFNAANPGSFSKTITVTTNDSDVNKVLSIKGKVLTPEGTATPATEKKEI